MQYGRPGFNPWVGKIPREGNGYPLQYSGLENSMDCIVHGVAKSQSDMTEQLSLFNLSSEGQGKFPGRSDILSETQTMNSNHPDEKVLLLIGRALPEGRAHAQD